MKPLSPERLAESRADKELYLSLLPQVREKLCLPPEGGTLHGILVPNSYQVEDGCFETVVDQSPIFCFIGDDSSDGEKSMDAVRWDMNDGVLTRIEGVSFYCAKYPFGKEFRVYFPRQYPDGEESVMVAEVEGNINRVSVCWGDADYEEEWTYFNVYKWSFIKTNRLFTMIVAGDLEAIKKRYWK